MNQKTQLTASEELVVTEDVKQRLTNLIRQVQPGNQNLSVSGTREFSNENLRIFRKRSEHVSELCLNRFNKNNHVKIIYHGNWNEHGPTGIKHCSTISKECGF